jgi:hypothetical protein
MKFFLGLAAAGAMLLAMGCAHRQPAPNSSPAPANSPPQPVIQPDLRASGEVEMVNDEARFVVMSFPPGAVPQSGQRLDVYRNGLKIGEVKVTGPQHENDTVADIVTGDPQLHDEVRQE